MSLTICLCRQRWMIRSGSKSTWWRFELCQRRSRGCFNTLQVQEQESEQKRVEAAPTRMSYQRFVTTLLLLHATFYLSQCTFQIIDCTVCASLHRAVVCLNRASRTAPLKCSPTCSYFNQNVLLSENLRMPAVAMLMRIPALLCRGFRTPSSNTSRACSGLVRLQHPRQRSR